MLGRGLAGKKERLAANTRSDVKRAGSESTSEEVGRDRNRQPCKGGQHATDNDLHWLVFTFSRLEYWVTFLGSFHVFFLNAL